MDSITLKVALGMRKSTDKYLLSLTHLKVTTDRKPNNWNLIRQTSILGTSRYLTFGKMNELYFFAS